MSHVAKRRDFDSTPSAEVKRLVIDLGLGGLHGQRLQECCDLCECLGEGLRACLKHSAIWDARFERGHW